MCSRKRLTFIKDFINNESVCHFMVVQLFKLSTKDNTVYTTEYLNYVMATWLLLDIVYLLHQNSMDIGVKFVHGSLKIGTWPQGLVDHIGMLPFLCFQFLCVRARAYVCLHLCVCMRGHARTCVCACVCVVHENS